MFSRSTLSAAVAAAVLLSGCPTSPNPTACINANPQCEPGYTCRAQSGGWACWPAEGGGMDSRPDAQPPLDSRDSGPGSDAPDGPDTPPGADAGPDTVPTSDGPPPLVDAQPDTVGPDVSSCPSVCTIGQRQCQGGGLRECMTIAGCPVWSTPTTCQAPLTCQETTSGMAACSCPANSCTVGHRDCGSGSGVRQCMMVTGCPAWSGEMACQGAQRCTPAGDTASCTCQNAPCTLGNSSCGPAGGTRQCMMVNGCPAWSGEMACQGAQRCTPAGDTASCTCQNAPCTLGNSSCGPTGGTRQCATVDNCPAWGAETPCQAPRICTATGGTASCECPPGGCLPTDGRILHVEADQGLMFVSGNKVSRWVDQSGLGHDGVPFENPATRGTNVLAGAPVVDFSGAGGGRSSSPQGLSFGSGYTDLSAGFTSFALVRVVDPGTPIGDIFLSVPALRGGPDNSDVSVALTASEGHLNILYTASGTTIDGTAMALDRWALVAVTHTPGGTVRIYVDGTVVTEASLAPPPFSTRAATLSGGLTQAEIALLIVYDRALSNEERTTVESFIASKWRYR